MKTCKTCLLLLLVALICAGCDNRGPVNGKFLDTSPSMFGTKMLDFDTNGTVKWYEKVSYDNGVWHGNLVGWSHYSVVGDTLRLEGHVTGAVLLAKYNENRQYFIITGNYSIDGSDVSLEHKFTRASPDLQ